MRTAFARLQVTHEFRTPLTSIKASISTLLSGAALDESGKRELMTVIDEETDRLNRLVGEAAEMAQLDAGMFKLDLQPHSIRDALDPALEDARKRRSENHPVEIVDRPQGAAAQRVRHGRATHSRSPDAFAGKCWKVF